MLIILGGRLRPPLDPHGPYPGFVLFERPFVKLEAGDHHAAFRCGPDWSEEVRFRIANRR